MSRHAARLAASLLLACGGFAAALAVALPAGSVAPRGATSTSPVPGTTAVAGTTTSQAAEVLAVTGHGWGHGLGLSQWGAYGYALHGFSAERILAHYYPGTTLGPAPAHAVRVLLARRKQITLGSTAAWRAADAAGTTIQLDPGDATLTAGGKLQGRPVTLPVTFTAPAPIAVAGSTFRGRIVVSLDGTALQVVNVVGLEAYLKGVVPAEMPSDWPPAALQAQAIAARSYALANRVQGRAFDLYGDVRDQVYGGIDAESPTSSAAVDATKGRVLLFGGTVADTLFFSTSGGRTASAAEVLGTPVPYLVSVPDPYDTISPVHDWGPMLFDVATVAKKLKVEPAIADVQVAAGPSGRVRTVTVVGADESQASFTGAQLRAALGLRSTWFTPSLFALAPRSATIDYGGAASLTGFVRGAAVGPLALEAKPFGGDWTQAATVVPGADGSFSAIVKPQLRTTYRLAAGSLRAGLTTVAVAPLVTAAIIATGATGRVRPVVVGAPVQLQRGDAGVWTTVAAATTDASGGLSFAGPLAAGDYRVRCAPGRGLQPGLSATVTLP